MTQYKLYANVSSLFRAILAFVRDEGRCVEILPDDAIGVVYGFSANVSPRKWGITEDAVRADMLNGPVFQSVETRKRAAEQLAKGTLPSWVMSPFESEQIVKDLLDALAVAGAPCVVCKLASTRVVRSEGWPRPLYVCDDHEPVQANPGWVGNTSTDLPYAETIRRARRLLLVMR